MKRPRDTYRNVRVVDRGKTYRVTFLMHEPPRPMIVMLQRAIRGKGPTGNDAVQLKDSGIALKIDGVRGTRIVAEARLALAEQVEADG